MSNIEKEIKILEIDTDAVKKKLDELGATVLFDDIMEALFFDFSDHKLEKASQILRLRKEGEEVELVFKQKQFKENFRDNVEISVQVEDFENMVKILEQVGFSAQRPQKKHRIEYQLHEVKIAIDTYLEHLDFIPTFLEVEGEDENAIFKYAKILGFSEKDFSRWSTKELVAHYEKQK